MESWVILVTQLLTAHTFLEREKHPLTMCNCCLSDYTAICHSSGSLHVVFRGLGKFATVLARRNVGCEDRPGGIGSVITLHPRQVLSSNEMQVGGILNKSISLSKEIQMFR